MPDHGQMVLLACHGVYDRRSDRFLADHPEDRPVHAAQLYYAVRHLQWRAGSEPLLVLSGGRTQIELRRSESRSYVEWAEQLGIRLPGTVVLEEYALSSIENLLFGLYRYHQTRRCYPRGIDVISWGFKELRFATTLQAIKDCYPGTWPHLSLEFFPVGDLPAADRAVALATENHYCDALRRGLSAYYADAAVQTLLAKRDAWRTRVRARQYYRGYPLPF